MPEQDLLNAINQLRTEVVQAVNDIDMQKYYALLVQAGQISIADHSTLYFDNKGRNGETTDAYAGLVIPKGGIIRVACIMSYTITSIWGSGESIPVYVRINHAQDHFINTRSIVSPNRLTYWNKFDMNVPVIQGDILSIKVAFPDFVTVPGSTSWAGNILIEY